MTTYFKPSATLVAARAGLLAIAPEQRSAWVLDQLLPLMPTRPEVDVNRNSSILHLFAGLPTPSAGFPLFRDAIRDVLGIPFYPVELEGKRSLNAIAAYLTEETLAEFTEVADYVDDPLQGGVWAWGDPAGEPPGEPQGDPLDPAVLVLSAPRSGSTLFRAILAGHPDLFSPPELNLLPFRDMKERAQKIDRLGYAWMRGGPFTALLNLEGLSPEAAQQRLAAMEREATPVRQLYAHLQAQARPRLLVDKSPLYALSDIWLERAERAFRDPIYVHLVRHPLSVMESFARMRFHRLLGPHWPVWDPNPWRLGEKVWLVCHRQILDTLSHVPPTRQTLIRYEDLVTAPEETCRRLCAFLNLPYVPAMADPYAGERMLRSPFTGIRATATIGDPNLLTHAAIDPDLADAWKRAPSPRPLSAPTLALMRELGYPEALVRPAASVG